jgi:hypothetical protein
MYTVELELPKVNIKECREWCLANIGPNYLVTDSESCLLWHELVLMGKVYYSFKFEEWAILFKLAN